MICYWKFTEHIIDIKSSVYEFVMENAKLKIIHDIYRNRFNDAEEKKTYETTFKLAEKKLLNYSIYVFWLFLENFICFTMNEWPLTIFT